MTTDKRIYVAGGDTLIGRALIERVRETGYGELVGVPPDEPDLTHAGQVEDFFAEARPEFVFVAAGMSAGIEANQRYPADLMLNNLLASIHVLSAAAREGVEKLLYLGSSCVYPRDAAQPLRPEALQTGALEPTNAAYATAKLAGMALCQAYRQQLGKTFITAIPANVFGPFDDFSEATGHVIPALMRRMHEASERGDEALDIWGSGTPRRDFIFAPDVADACLLLMERYEGPGPINIGSGKDWSIAEVAKLIAEVVGYRGRLHFDTKKPDGMPRKCLDATDLFALGWQPCTDLRIALVKTYAWFGRFSPQRHRDAEKAHEPRIARIARIERKTETVAS